jgi:hypothetical protein
MGKGGLLVRDKPLKSSKSASTSRAYQENQDWLPQRSGDLSAIIAAFADHALHGTGAAPNVALGPIVWGIYPGHDTRHWYFVVCSVDAKGELRIDQFTIAQDDRDLAEQSRAGLMLEMMHRKPIVLVDFDDELPMARWCEALCPGERTSGIRAGIERERAEKAKGDADPRT